MYDYPAAPKRPDYQEATGMAPGDQISEDNKRIQKYFSLFKKSPSYEYADRGRQSFAAFLELPLPPQTPSQPVSSVKVEAMGKNKKEARAALIRKMLSKIETEGLMDGATRFVSARKGKRFGPDSMNLEGVDTKKLNTKSSNSSLRNQIQGGSQMSIDNMPPDFVPDSWDSVPSGPPSRDPRSRQRSSAKPRYSQPLSSWENEQASQSANNDIDWWDERPPAPPEPTPSSNQFSRPNYPSSDLYRSFGGDNRHYRPPHHGGFHDHRRDVKLRPSAPHSSTRLPGTIDDAVRKYVQFYCNKFQLEIPTPHTTQQNQFQHSTRGHGGYSRRPKMVQGDWHTRLVVAAHTTVEGNQTEAIEGIGVAKSKKDSAPYAWEDLCSRLLVLSPQSLVDQFISFATPFKKRLAEMLMAPIRVEISDSAVDKLETILMEMKDKNAFHIPEDLAPQQKPPLLLGAPSSYDGQNSFGGGRLHPRDLPVPAELHRSRDLPMYAYYSSVMAAIENNSVTILSAETGAGKTTQLPQFILAHSAAMRQQDPRRPPIKVIVTQPRRIAAISVAQRVASERGETLGKDSAIGYQVRYDDMRPKSDPQKGHVVFCTSGILLRRMQDDPTLSGVTHVILDEVHERDLNTDLLLVITRQLLRHRPDLKLILMSATAETGLFAEYFKGFGGDRTTNFLPPIFQLEIPTPHTTQQNQFQHSTRGHGGYSRRPKMVQGDWHTRLVVAAHTTVEGNQTEAIEGIGVAKSKKDSAPYAWEDLCSRLLVLSPQSLVDQFISFATPFKKRLAEMLMAPIRVEISDSAVDKLETILMEMKDKNAFHIPEDLAPQQKPPLLLGAPSSYDGQNSFGGGRLHPRDLPVPAELHRSRDLPMYAYYSSVMAAIENNSVTILSAETGAGKTTQLPQFILAHSAAMRQQDPRRPPIKVIVTQPRRIAAISVAQRVASERGETLGKDSAIGYQVRYDDMRPKSDPQKGHVVFCTSGILLRRMQDDPTLSGVTHVILDEVHERDLNTDLLLVITRQLLRHRPDLKLILMSATAETGLFAEYFKGFGGDRTTNFLPPIVNVPGRLFPVEEFCLEDLVDIAERKMRARLSPDTQKFLRNELGGPSPSMPSRSDDLPFDLFEAIIAYITTSMPPGAILVFLPGWLEINSLMSRLKDEDNFRVGFGNPNTCKIYPLHSSVPTAGQQEVFDKPPAGIRKIILSTNIAETSVTINDIVYVLDSGKIRINSYDSDSRISSLSSVWGSQSNIRQRSGRAGRCQPGQYYTLLSRRRLQSLPYAMPPELLRVDLQSTALKIKALNIGSSVGAVLSQAPQPPSRFNVDRALDELRALGALDEYESLTPLGNVLSDMPVDPWIGKMVLQGAVYGCLDPILTVAGAMEIGRGIYSIHPDDKQRARRHILMNFAKNTESDQLTMLVAYRQWKASGSSRSFAMNNFLHGTSLLNIDRAKNQLLRVLEDGGFLQRRRVAASFSSKPDWSGEDDLMGGPEANIYGHDMGMVRAILCGSLFPNVAEVYGKDEYRSLNDAKLRLTGGSVNSWRGLVISSGADGPPPPEHPAVTGKPVLARGRQTPVDTSDVLDSVSDDEDDKESIQATEFMGAPLPTRLLSFQDKQRVDGGVYLRSTTRADPLALLLLSPGQMARNGAASLNWTRVEGRPAAILGGWLRIQVQDEQRARIIEDIRAWLAKYLDWIVWNRALRKEKGGSATAMGANDDELGRRLIKVVGTMLRMRTTESTKLDASPLAAIVVQQHDGPLVDGKFGGEGTIAFKSGHKYVGNFKDGFMDGNGVYTWKDSVTYAGEFKMNKMSGQGAYKCSQMGVALKDKLKMGFEMDKESSLAQTLNLDTKVNGKMESKMDLYGKLE
ncbi:hypothetical protein HDU67_005159 [Dinochytrium kinnereticum]|nr:hypothetical protein HDU67_005159 [Dinochytrium kinnereticum]